MNWLMTENGSTEPAEHRITVRIGHHNETVRSEDTTGQNTIDVDIPTIQAGFETSIGQPNTSVSTGVGRKIQCGNVRNLERSNSPALDTTNALTSSWLATAVHTSSPRTISASWLYPGQTFIFQCVGQENFNSAHWEVTLTIWRNCWQALHRIWFGSWQAAEERELCSVCSVATGIHVTAED